MTTLPEELDAQMEFDGEDMWIKLKDGTKIAKRENRQWTNLHPNWTVTQDGDELQIEFHPNVNN